MKNICVIGTGYVGLVTGACFAELGNRVRCVDTDEAKVASLREGVLPIYEPGLDSMVQQNMEAGRLAVTTSYTEGMEDVDFVFVTVGTPNTPEGDVDLRGFRRAYEMAASNLNGNRPIFVNKSTVPPGTSDMMGLVLARLRDGLGPLPIVANPEFLKEGHAVSDFMNPARVVVGARDPQSAQAVAELHKPLGCPILVTDPRSAEMIKYASNAFLAMKISFVNEMAEICDRVGVDVTGVAQGMGMDPRIGKDFLNAGIGYGGSCLPKDMAVLIRLAADGGYEAQLLNAAVRVNYQQPVRLVRRVKEALGTLRAARIAVLGLTFKPNTDDTRHSSAIEIIKQLQAEGAEVTACDPQACQDVRTLPTGVEYVTDPFQAAQGCAAVILATEWPQYTSLDLKRLKAVMDGHILADGRNAFDPEEATQAGFVYIGVGRAPQAPVMLEQAVVDPVLVD